MNALNADIIVIVGGLVNDGIDNIKDDLELLRDLKSSEGIYYVSGNHEYYRGIDSILEYLHTFSNIAILEKY